MSISKCLTNLSSLFKTEVDVHENLDEKLAVAARIRSLFVKTVFGLGVSFSLAIVFVGILSVSVPSMSTVVTSVLLAVTGLLLIGFSLAVVGLILISKREERLEESKRLEMRSRAEPELEEVRSEVSVFSEESKETSTEEEKPSKASESDAEVKKTGFEEDLGEAEGPIDRSEAKKEQKPSEKEEHRQLSPETLKVLCERVLKELKSPEKEDAQKSESSAEDRELMKELSEKSSEETEVEEIKDVQESKDSSEASEEKKVASEDAVRVVVHTLEGIAGKISDEGIDAKVFEEADREEKISKEEQSLKLFKVIQGKMDSLRNLIVDVSKLLKEESSISGSPGSPPSSKGEEGKSEKESPDK
ncbi:DMT family transporter [Chlamydiifrater phoenicopteri]|uniref:DMT family transporter n=1 Tax=Chlamydiifrater phoenicopteri TaxID=2681469 RepID=UPI001BCA832D|nr:DMT family transporter [Chlamydiifrater phoenicopteri]